MGGSTSFIQSNYSPNIFGPAEIPFLVYSSRTYASDCYMSYLVCEYIFHGPLDMIFTFLVITKDGRLKFIFGVPSFVGKDRKGVSQLGNSWIWPKDTTQWAPHHTNDDTTQTLGFCGFVHPSFLLLGGAH